MRQTKAVTMMTFSLIDKAILAFDQGLRTLATRPYTTERANPAADLPDATISQDQTRDIAGMMRINHAGEVCAQALYQGQAMTAQLTEVREAMQRAAEEENDHLDWCAQRLNELGSHRSVLNPAWYIGSLSLGMLAGVIGDKWSLGFVVETERQVVKHLEEHIERVPKADQKTQAILAQMKEDELHHATIAYNAGGAELPAPVKTLMSMMSKVMTGTAYYI